MNIYVYPAKSENTRWIEKKEGVIVLNAKTGIYHKLNSSATFIWHISNGIKTIRQIIRLVAEEYDITTEKAEKDVCRILTYLESVGLVELFSDSRRFYPPYIKFKK